MAATVWKGFISFGLVSIPVRLYSGAGGKKSIFICCTKKTTPESTR
jgi:non-homologous end joining protein Ku